MNFQRKSYRYFFHPLHVCFVASLCHFDCHVQLRGSLLTVLKLRDLLVEGSQSVSRCVCWDAGVRNDVKLIFCANSPLCRS
jgi:hypothetical protein